MSNGHAVVCGASIAGLLAAKVLSEFHRAVTVVERDVLPELTSQRRGVSQGQHLHQMLSGGVPYLVESFPGILDELESAGAIVVHGPDDPARFHLAVGQTVFCKTGRLTRSADMVLVLASRPLLETVIRRRVRAIPNVTFLDGHDVVEPTIDPTGRVTGVHVVELQTGRDVVLRADLVVDATGRAARTPAFLQAHGFARPQERRYAIQLSYSSQFFRVAPGAFTEQAVVNAPSLAVPEGAGVLAYEDGTVVVTVIGLAGRNTPLGQPEFLESATRFLPAHVGDALRDGQPTGEVFRQRYPASVWRRYDKLVRFPPGFLVIGDAVCSFNPVYGQGMTSAAMQAAALRRCLAAGTDRLSQRFFGASARRLAPIWWTNRLFDFAIIPSSGWRGRLQKLVNAGLNEVYSAAVTDVVLTETIFRQMQLLGRPTDILRPSTLKRVIVRERRQTVRRRSFWCPR
jgi:2-polyprenyl-6-methoxyphenol hydroxylase-like FAD-dependent oxidoreductase